MTPVACALEDRRCIRVAWIDQQTDPRQAGHRARLQLDLLGNDVIEGAGEPSHVAARTSQAGHESTADRIGRVTHDDRDGARSLLRRPNRRRRRHHDDLDLQAHHFGREFAETLVLSFRQTPLDDEVLTLPIAELAHALQEAVEFLPREIRRAASRQPAARSPPAASQRPRRR
jgi:hypothetical protein